MKISESIGNYFEENTIGVALGMTIDRAMNNFSSDRIAKETAEYIITYSHRTIQQSIMRAILIFLRKMAAVEHYDDRNAASVKAAKAMVAAYDNEKLSLPFI